MSEMRAFTIATVLLIAVIFLFLALSKNNENPKFNIDGKPRAIQNNDETTTVTSRNFHARIEVPKCKPNSNYDEIFVGDRRKALTEAESARRKLLEASKSLDNKEFYEKITIEAYCPKIIRIGETDDGGKFVCNPEMIPDDCTLMSLGLNNQIGFDIQIQSITQQRCKIIGTDIAAQNEATLETYKKINGQTYVGRIGPELSIGNLLEKSGATRAEMLKIDIENAEHEALPPFLRDYLVCQIFVEIHGTPSQHLQLMQKIANLGFRLFSFEPNPYCPTCCEYSYINELCMQQYHMLPLSSRVPLNI